MKTDVYGYLRVSTVRQGEKGVSLQEQKSAIEQYAIKHDLTIVQWFEERETAAKQGRPVFTKMLNLLQKNKVSGVIIHKIDRSARNLKDWALLGDLIDDGIDIHFAHESIDLTARGGRLSADIQAVIAADYIRNLRQETKKGMYGRLKQGLYPWPAPLGYLNCGPGQPKEIDNQKEQFIKEAFDLYATGEHSLNGLRKHMANRGLRNAGGKKVSKTGLANILSNPFYIGLIYMKSTGETFKGIHEPMVSKTTFDIVQNVLAGKRVKGTGKHSFQYRRLFKCSQCNYSVIGEKQKGFKYYRCHTKDCKGVSVREESIDKELMDAFTTLKLPPFAISEIDERIDEMKEDRQSAKKEELKTLNLTLDAAKTRFNKLTDLFIDGDLDRDSYNQRKESLLHEMRKIEENIEKIESETGTTIGKKIEILELVKSLYQAYSKANSVEKREMVENYTSNCLIRQKKVMVELFLPFKQLSDLFKIDLCWGNRIRT